MQENGEKYRWKDKFTKEFMESNRIEMKNMLPKIKNALDGLNSRFDTAENNVLEDKLGVIYLC